MVKEHTSLIRKLYIFLDVIIVFLTGFLLNYIFSIYHEEIIIIPNIRAESFYYLILFFNAFSLIYFMYDEGIYHSIRYISYWDIIKKIVFTFLKTFLIISIFLILTKPIEFPLSYYIKYILLLFFIINLEKIGIKFFLSKIREKGFNYKSILLLGNKEGIKEIEEDLIAKHKDWGLKIIDTVYIEDENSLDKLENVLKSRVIDEVFVVGKTGVPLLQDDLKKHVFLIEEFWKPIRFIFTPHSYMSLAKASIAFLDDIPTLYINFTNISEDMLIIKRIMDIIGGLIGSIITILIFPIVGIMIKLDSPGPILFKQRRIGENGRIFYIYKFRTMYVDAEERKKELLKNNEMKGAIFKMKNDPRVTKVGRFLRKFSIDEFPQFFNVLKGDMSLVGTRPPTEDEVRNYENWHHRRIIIKPGITGLWQVSGRNKITDFDKIVELDMEYIKNWSIWLDIKIIFKTIFALFEGQ